MESGVDKNLLLFEGKTFSASSIGRVERRGNTIWAEIDGNLRIIACYHDEDWAALGEKYLLYRLGRMLRWI